MTGLDDGVGRYENVAQDNAHVSAQIGVVHNGFHQYIVAESESPRRKHAVGRDRLEGGMPRDAERLIDQAVSAGYVSTEVAYHWTLSILSDRSFDDLQAGHFESLRKAFKLVRNEPEDHWTQGVRVIGRLLDHLVSRERADRPADGELASVRKEYQALGRERRQEFRRHLDKILVGALRDGFASKEMEEAEVQRIEGDREERAWKFFAADPAPPEPLTLPPEPRRVGAAVRLASGVVLAVAGLILAFPALAHRAGGAAAALALTTAGVSITVTFGLRRQVRLDRIQAENARFDPPVDEHGLWKPHKSFDWRVRFVVRGAFAAHDPQDVEERRLWKEEAEGVQLRLTKELAETFRDREVFATSVSYLARLHARQIVERWSEAGRLRGFRSRLGSPPRVFLGIAVGILTACVGALMTWTILWRHGGFVDYALLPAVIAFGVDIACDQWLAIHREKRSAECARRYRDRRYREECDAYRAWCAVLTDRPTDQEMARWLDLDRRYLRAKAMELYGLANREVVAHLVLCEDAPKCKRARVSGGPIRYTAYLISVLLMSDWGVRLTTFHADFLTGECKQRSRTVFRYDSVASAQVTQVWVKTSGTHRRIVPLNQEHEERPEGRRGTRRDAFRISLVNAQPITVLLERFRDQPDTEDREDEDREDEEQQDDKWKDWSELQELELNSSGVAGALHVMEAITADGRQWLAYEAKRRKRRLHDLGIGSFMENE